MKSIFTIKTFKKNRFNIILFAVFFSGLFQAYPQSITVISPNGGEKWEANSTQIIKWESENINEVTIEYSLDNGLSWGIIISSIDASIGEYSWVPEDAETPYVLIRISNTFNFSEYDINDENFSLVKKNHTTDKSSAINNTTTKIMPLGDSITWGTNPENPSNTGYRRYLYHQLLNTGYNVDFIGSLIGGTPDDFDRDNEGHPGMYTYRRTNPSLSMQDKLLGYLTDNSPDIILLHIGTNDFGSAIEPKSNDSIAKDVVLLLDIINNFDSEITTVLAKIINRRGNQAIEDSTTQFNIKLGEKADSLIALGRKIVLVDMESQLNYTTDLADDGSQDVHPNDIGYQKMAHAWFNTLTNILPAPQIFVNTKIFLQGPYISGTMGTALNAKGFLQMYASSQPYNAAPWNYNGNESVVSNFFINNPLIVDWILVELRDKNDPCTIIAARAGFIKSDGSIVDIDGISNLSFNNILPDKYYVSLKHRNHLSVMSSIPEALDNNILVYDFTTDSSQFYGSSSGAIKLESGIWGMMASDGNADGFINSADLNLTWRPNNGFDEYSNGDYNLDGSVNAIDKNLFWRFNEGLDSQVPIN